MMEYPFYMRLCFVVSVLLASFQPVVSQSWKSPSLYPQTTPKRNQLKWHKDTDSRIKYRIPPGWTYLQQKSSNACAATYVSPDEEVLFFAHIFRGAGLFFTPEHALTNTLRELGVRPDSIRYVHSRGLLWSQTTSTDTLRGKRIHLEIKATRHKRNVLLFYVCVTDRSYDLYQHTLRQLLGNITPYRGWSLF